MSELVFHIKKNDKGQFHWTLKAHNNKDIAWSGEEYKTEQNCLKAMGLIINGARTADLIDETSGTPIPRGRASLHVPPPTHDGT